MKHYITGRKSEKFTDLEDAKKYADKWRDNSISVYEYCKYRAEHWRRSRIIAQK